MFTNIKGDILGGLTAGIVALPLALAFGVSSGLGPSAGLYGAIFLTSLNIILIIINHYLFKSGCRLKT